MTNAQRTVKSRRVSGELRRYRELAGLTVTEVARRLDMSQGQLSRLELGIRGLSISQVATMLATYGAPASKMDELVTLLREAGEPGWWAPTGKELPADWQAFIDFEQRATSLTWYELVLVPGLLQTTDYARAVIEGSACTELSDNELDTKVSARLGRQGILSRRDAPRLDVFLYEAVLNIPVGSPEIMRHQLRHLVEMAARPGLSVRVIPLSVGVHPGLDGPFVIMEFDGQPTLVYTQSKTRSAFLEEEDLKIYRLVARRLDALALDRKESIEFIAAKQA